MNEKRLAERYRLTVLACAAVSLMTLADAFLQSWSRPTESVFAAGVPFFALFLFGWASFSGVVLVPAVSHAVRRFIYRSALPPEDAVAAAQLVEYGLWQLPSILGFAGLREGGTLLFAVACSVVTVVGSLLSFPRRELWAEFAGADERPHSALKGWLPSERLAVRRRVTLCEAIERNRGRRALVMVSFVVVWTAGIGLILWVAVARPLLHLEPLPGLELADQVLGLPPQLTLFAVSLCVGFGTGCFYVRWALRQPEWRFLQRLGARHIRPNDLPVTYEALRQVALAAGIHPVPALHVFDSEAGINAIVVGRRPTTSAVAVTRGLAAEDMATQRAVFASLLSRFRDGGLSWTTLLVYLIWPLTVAKRAVWLRAQRWPAHEGRGLQDGPAAFLGLVGASMILILTGTLAQSDPAIRDGIDLLPVTAIAIGEVVLGVPVLAAILAAVLVVMFRGSHRTMVLSADAEGLMLLKDPQELGQALRDVLLADNGLPHLKDLGFLAFTNDDGKSDELAERLAALDACTPDPI